MSIRHIRITIAPDESSKTLSEILHHHLPVAFGQPFNSTQIRKIIVVGAVHVNRKRVSKVDAIFNKGDAIDCYLDPEKIEQPRETPQISEADIAYEDSDILIMDKPSGLPTQPTLDRSRDNLYTQLLTLQAKREGASAYVGLHHRLDRDTSGLILFTKKREANRAIGDAFKNKTISKTYESIVHRASKTTRPLEEKFEIQSYIAKSSVKKGKRALYQSVKSGGDFAHTRFERVEARGDFVWLRCYPVTGRTHQIRIHCADRGYPIVGDLLYGENLPRSRLFLHAAALTFEHPSTKKTITVHSKVPEEFQNYFQAIK